MFSTIAAREQNKKSKLLLTVGEVAESLRLDEATIRRKLQRREIPGTKIGRDWRIPRKKFEELFGLN